MRTYRFVTLFPAVSLLAACAAATSSPRSRVQPWQTVRVTAPSAGLDRKKEQFLAIGDDSLLLVRFEPRGEFQGYRMEDTIPWAIPLAAVSRLEVRRGFTPGGAIGAVAGFGVGLSLAARVECGEIDPMCFYKGMGVALVSTWVGALVGTGLEAVVAPGLQWEQVPLGGLRIGATPLPGGRLGLGTGFRF